MRTSSLCEMCQRCHDDGLRDDEECPYYGEPNGCNHPKGGISRFGDESVESICTELRKFFAGNGHYIDCDAGDEDYEFFAGLADRIDAAHTRSVNTFLAGFNIEVERLKGYWNTEHDARVNDCNRVLKEVVVKNNLMEAMRVIQSCAASYDGDHPDAELAEQIVWSVKRYAECALKEAEGRMAK